MICEKKPIVVDYEQLKVVPPEKPATLTSYILDIDTLKNRTWSKRPAVLVCPGGGYTFCSDREAEPIALAFNGRGFHSFVLDYSCKPTGFPCAITELSKAIVYIRSIAAEYNIDPDQIFVCGFSAGAHLACSLGVYWNTDWLKEYTGISGEENRPNGMILGYPVITQKKGVRHTDSFKNWMCGKEEYADLFALEDHVTADTPSAFIWHTCSDNGVNVENSLLLATAMRKEKINLELHIFPYGAHGLALSNAITADASWDEYQHRPEVECWIDMACRWVVQQKDTPKYIYGEAADSD
jgi:acetyl esterase/lipase